MKRLLSFTLPLILATTLGALAQSDTTPSPSSTNQATSPTSSSSTQSNTQSSTSTQANPATSSMSQSGTTATNQPSLEGCIIRQQTDYFLQPDTGQPVKLNSSQDLSQHVGHRVRVEGTINNGANSSSTNNQSPTGANGTSAPNTGTAGSSPGPNAGTEYQEMTVTRVEMISETCPASMQNQTNNPGQSPKQ